MGALRERMDKDMVLRGCNIRTVMSRHIDIAEAEGDFRVCYYKDEPLKSFQATLDSATGLLLGASRSLHDSYKTGKLGEVDEMLQELNAIRDGYGA